MSRKKVQVEFNSEIKDKLNEIKVPLHEGLGYLTNLHYGLQPHYVPETLKQKIFTSGIVTYNHTIDDFIWNIPLFEEAETNFEWIKEWMDLFKAVNPARRGVKKDVLIRMKRFFVNNPSVRKEDVFTATKNYLKTVQNPMYCKNAHKFIYEQDGTSMLESYVSSIQETQERQNYLNDEIV